MEYNLVDIQNRLILKDDVDVFVNYKDENKLDEKYIHPAGTWSHSDACIKWIASIFILESIEKKDRRYKNGVVPLKIVDLGAGDGPVAHMVADKGHDVVGVDVRSYNFLYQSLAVMVTRDAMEYLKEYEDNIKMMKTNRKILRELDLPQYKQNLDDNIFAFSRGYNYMHKANVIEDHINILDEDSIENKVTKLQFR